MQTLPNVVPIPKTFPPPNETPFPLTSYKRIPNDTDVKKIKLDFHQMQQLVSKHLEKHIGLVYTIEDEKSTDRYFRLKIPARLKVRGYISKHLEDDYMQLREQFLNAYPSVQFEEEIGIVDDVYRALIISCDEELIKSAIQKDEYSFCRLEHSHLDDDHLISPLHYFCQVGNFRLIRLILANLKKENLLHLIQKKDEVYGQTVFHVSLSSKIPFVMGLKYIIQHLISQMKLYRELSTCFMDRDASGYTPLHYAVKIMNAQFIQFLMKCKLMPTFHSFPTEFSLLDVWVNELVCHNRHRTKDLIQIGKILLEIGDCVSVIHPIIKHYNSIQSEELKQLLVKIIERYIERGGDVNAVFGGTIPIYWMAYSGCADLVPILVDKYGANVKYIFEGDNLLHIATKKGNYSVVNLLSSRVPIEYMNMKNADGDTVLHIASRLGNVNLVTLFVHNPNVNINELNRYSRTALNIAYSYRYNHIVQLLEKEGGIKTPSILDILPDDTIHYIFSFNFDFRDPNSILPLALTSRRVQEMVKGKEMWAFAYKPPIYMNITEDWNSYIDRMTSKHYIEVNKIPDPYLEVTILPINDPGNWQKIAKSDALIELLHTQGFYIYNFRKELTSDEVRDVLNIWLTNVMNNDFIIYKFMKSFQFTLAKDPPIHAKDEITLEPVIGERNSFYGKFFITDYGRKMTLVAILYEYICIIENTDTTKTYNQCVTF